MAPSGICVALAFTALMGVCLGELNEATAALIDTLASDKTVRQHTHEGATLYIRELSKGASDGPTPSLKNPCNVSYMGKLPDGTTFDGTRAPKTVIPSSLFNGLRHTLTLMRPGDKWEVTIPPELAFGDSNHGAIPGGSAVVFMIELHDVLPEPTGIWAVIDFVVKNPMKIILATYLLKLLLDWYLGVSTPPSGPCIPLKMVQGADFNGRVSLDVSIDGKAAGTITCELFVKTVPVTAEMFRTVCCTDPPNVKKGRPNNRFVAVSPEEVRKGRLCFRAVNTVSTVAPDFDVLPKAETDKGFFAHDTRYLVSVSDAHKLDDEKEMEFFITLGKADHWNGQHVVIGAVVEGQAIVDKMEELRREDTPVIITKCKTVRVGGDKKEQ